MNTLHATLFIRIILITALLIPLIITLKHVIQKTRTMYFLYLIIAVYGLIVGLFLTTSASKTYIFLGVILLCLSMVIGSWAKKMEDFKKANPNGNIDSKKVFITETQNAGLKLQGIVKQMFFTLIGFIILIVIPLAILVFIRFQYK